MSEQTNKEVLTKEEAQRIEAVFFEDDAKIKLRDGKEYIIPPASLKNARKLMQKLKTINVDVIILNFIPTGDEEKDKERENDLFEVLSLAFVGYPEVTREYIDEYVDVELAKKIIDILIGLNGLKK